MSKPASAALEHDRIVRDRSSRPRARRRAPRATNPAKSRVARAVARRHRRGRGRSRHAGRASHRQQPLTDSASPDETIMCGATGVTLRAKVATVRRRADPGLPCSRAAAGRRDAGASRRAARRDPRAASRVRRSACRRWRADAARAAPRAEWSRRSAACRSFRASMDRWSCSTANAVVAVNDQIDLDAGAERHAFEDAPAGEHRIGGPAPGAMPFEAGPVTVAGQSERDRSCSAARPVDRPCCRDRRRTPAA